MQKYLYGVETRKTLKNNKIQKVQTTKNKIPPH